ncbi:hypothetical protein [Salinispora vitiensis]|uniref:hypothetical protein n=1 Tax=Salinispora vitiensis TaxID=999544 RepID=UPI0003822405|nr:hypothetical protein [Salinispora vitiensis]
MHTDRTDTTERQMSAASPTAEPQTTPESGYMSCPRECGVDVREHASSGLIDGRCDTGGAR